MTGTVWFDVAVAILAFADPFYLRYSMNNNQASQDPVVLPLGATAETKTCGSCTRFERREPWNGDHGGYCNLRLPPQYAKVPYNSEGKPPNRVNDTHGCDLWFCTGKAYLVSHVVRP